LFGATVISDVYNANPASMEEAVKELVRLRKVRAIAVLGDMLELGSYAEEAHRKLGEWMSKLPIDIFIAVGPLMAEAESLFAKKGGQSFRAATASEAGEILIGICREDDTVLVKGSRGMGMEKVLEINKGTGNAV
ncbi:MAG: cyanophycin synthetase, partial [Thermodesulfovibrionales bacterium]